MYPCLPIYLLYKAEKPSVHLFGCTFGTLITQLCQQQDLLKMKAVSLRITE